LTLKGQKRRQQSFFLQELSEDRNCESINAVSLSGSNRSTATTNRTSRFIYVGRKETSGRLPSSEARWYIGSAINAARALQRGSGQETAHPRRRRVGEIYRRVLFFFISSSPFSFSLPRASAARFAESKAPAEMRRAATREWNIIARDSSAVVVVAQLLHEVLSKKKITEIFSFSLSLFPLLSGSFWKQRTTLGKKLFRNIYLKIDDSIFHICIAIIKIVLLKLL